MHRIFTLKEKGLVKEAEGAYTRALDIIEKLLNHPDLEGRTGEIKMLKDYLKQSMENEQVQFLKKNGRSTFPRTRIGCFLTWKRNDRVHKTSLTFLSYANYFYET